MKMLIVDDNAKRYARFVDAAASSGIPRDSIEFSPSANDARDKLTNNRYDLMILDILLPLWPDGQPNENNSIDLLIELLDSGELSRPQQIIGITADDGVASKFFPMFSERLWTIIDYSESSDEWLHRLLNCAIYLQIGPRSMSLQNIVST